MYGERHDIVILGGGASGLAAAIEIKRGAPGADVVVIEKNKEPGRKILSTGNGKCNLSNMACRERDVTLSFFSSIGVMTRTDDAGRIYPYSEDAKDVRDALVKEAEALGVNFLTSSAVKECRFDQKDGIYRISFERKPAGEDGDLEEAQMEADRVLLSMGGKAAPKLGTTGDGYIIARKLYHSVTRLAPALTGVETREDISILKGARAKAKVSLIAGGGTIFEEQGEVQFTDYGISGIAVFNMSRYLVIPEGRTLVNGLDDYLIEIDFLPDTKDPLPMLKEREGSGMLRSLVKGSIASYIIQKTGGDPGKAAWMIKHFPLSPKVLRGWDHAEITKGGVPLTEINMETMASKMLPGLWISGEIIDYDGPAGGYNLQNAWETGIRAGRAIAGDYER